MSKEIRRREQCTLCERHEVILACGLCGACYSWKYYHSQQGVAAQMRYVQGVKRASVRLRNSLELAAARRRLKLAVGWRR